MTGGGRPVLTATSCLDNVDAMTERELTQDPHPDSAPSDPARRRYELIAPVYDWTSGERSLYAEARERAIDLLRLQPGASVLDVACGTGRNFALLEQRITRSGSLVGVDRSTRMLRQARGRVARHGWENIQLVQTDVRQLTPAQLRALGAAVPAAGFDAVLCTLGLSVIPDWEGAWQAMRAFVRPGGRIAVMDGGYPARPGAEGEAVAIRPLAWLICRIAAADPRRRPWELVVRDTDDVTVERFAHGYVSTAAGTVWRVVENPARASRRRGAGRSAPGPRHPHKT